MDIVPQKTVSTAMNIQQKKELMTLPINDIMPPTSGEMYTTTAGVHIFPGPIVEKRDDMDLTGYCQ
jgi:hypothetical protein